MYRTLMQNTRKQESTGMQFQYYNGLGLETVGSITEEVRWEVSSRFSKRRCRTAVTLPFPAHS